MQFVLLFALVASADGLLTESQAMSKEAHAAVAQRKEMLRKLESAKTTQELEEAREAFNKANAHAELVLKAQKKKAQSAPQRNSRVAELLQRSKAVSQADEQMVDKKKALLEELKPEKMQKMPEKTWDMKAQGWPFSDKPDVNLAISNGKSWACQDKGSEILMMYVNSNSHSERKTCMESQLNQHCTPYERFPAVEMAHCPEGDWMCMNHRVFNEHSDCITKDVDWEAISTHGSKTTASKWQVAMNVMGNWCSHYRLIKEIVTRSKKDPKFAEDYPAFMMLEDDVILDKEWTEEKLKDWVNNPPMDWDIVQIDPFGDLAPEDEVGNFRGKKIYKPSWKGNYYGFHAVMIKTATAEKILKKLDSFNVVPVDWIQKWINDDPQGLHSLAWDAGVTENPEKTEMYGGKLTLPDGCDASVTKTTIG